MDTDTAVGAVTLKAATCRRVECQPGLAQNLGMDPVPRVGPNVFQFLPLGKIRAVLGQTQQGQYNAVRLAESQMPAVHVHTTALASLVCLCDLSE